MIGPFIRFTNSDTVAAISSQPFILKLGARLENMRVNKYAMTLDKFGKTFATMGIVEFHSYQETSEIVVKFFKFTSASSEEFMFCRFDHPDEKLELVGPDLKSYLEDNLTVTFKFCPIGDEQYVLGHFDYFLAHRT